MARTVGTATRQDLLQAVRERYRGRAKSEKLRILDEFIAVTGYHRKHVIRLFNAAPVAGRQDRRARLPVYDDAVREALILLWEASDRVCGKRLKPLLPLLVTALERHGHLTLDVTVRARVLAASAATLDRMLRPTRASVAGKRVRRRAIPAVQKNVPVRTFAEWEDPQPGDMEADLVSHGGDSATGSFVHRSRWPMWPPGGPSAWPWSSATGRWSWRRWSNCARRCHFRCAGLIPITAASS